jgi:hypothetical protein
MHISLGHFEVIEVVDDNEYPSGSRRLLGYDLSAYYNASLLQSGLKSFPELSTLPHLIERRCEALNDTYGSQLNSCGLFEAYEIAASCLREIMALQMLCPNLFEGGGLNCFRVIGVYAVSQLI